MIRNLIFIDKLFMQCNKFYKQVNMNSPHLRTCVIVKVSILIIVKLNIIFIPKVLLNSQIYNLIYFFQRLCLQTELMLLQRKTTFS